MPIISVQIATLHGQAHDLRETALLIEDLKCGAFLGDRAFDADWLRSMLEEKDIAPVIPPKSTRKFPVNFDRDIYKARHLIENYFQKTKPLPTDVGRFA